MRSIRPGSESFSAVGTVLSYAPRKQSRLSLCQRRSTLKNKDELLAPVCHGSGAIQAQLWGFLVELHAPALWEH